MTEINLSNASGFVYDKYMTYSDFDLIKYCGIVETGFFKVLVGFSILYILSEFIFFIKIMIKNPSLEFLYSFLQKIIYNFLPVMFIYYFYLYLAEHGLITDNLIYILKTIFFIIIIIVAIIFYKHIYKGLAFTKMQAKK